MDSTVKPGCLDALSLVLERGVTGKASESHWTFLNASPIPKLSDDWKNTLSCEQWFRPEFNRLVSAGYRVASDLEEDLRSGSCAIVMLTRNRRHNEYKIANAWNALGPEGRLIVTGNKTDGIGSIRKWFGSHAAITDSYSKFHAIVFWADKASNPDISVESIRKLINGYHLAEGMFSSAGPDSGSKALVETFNDEVGGKIADLGAGWGYLSNELIRRSSNVSAIDLFEADYHALEAAKANVSSGGIDLSFHWIDVTSEFRKKPYDWVIMNPPFHSGRAAEPGLGQRFIEVAASTLPRGGKMLMVANRNLPYEKTIETCFRSFEQLGEHDGFKVLKAHK